MRKEFFIQLRESDFRTGGENKQLCVVQRVESFSLFWNLIAASLLLIVVGRTNQKMYPMCLDIVSVWCMLVNDRHPQRIPISSPSHLLPHYTEETTAVPNYWIIQVKSSKQHTFSPSPSLPLYDSLWVFPSWVRIKGPFLFSFNIAPLQSATWIIWREGLHEI